MPVGELGERGGNLPGRRVGRIAEMVQRHFRAGQILRVLGLDGRRAGGRPRNRSGIGRAACGFPQSPRAAGLISAWRARWNNTVSAPAVRCRRHINWQTDWQMKSAICGVHMMPTTIPQAAIEPAATIATAYPAASPPPPPMPSSLRTKKNSPMMSAALKTVLKIIFAGSSLRFNATTRQPNDKGGADDRQERIHRDLHDLTHA